MNVKRLLQFINIMILLVLAGLFVLSCFNELGFQERGEKQTKRDILLLVALNDMYAQGLQTGQEQLKKIAQLWQKDHAMKMEMRLVKRIGRL